MSGIVAQNLNRQSGLIKAAEAGGGAWTFISKTTASGDSTISIASGIDSTYGVYLITCNSIHPATTASEFRINFRDGSTAYDATKVTTYIKIRHAEADDLDGLVYDDGNDTAGTGGHLLMENVGNQNDASTSGTIYLYNPSSTTFVKNYICDFHSMAPDPAVADHILSAGYCNVTAAIDGVQFAFDTGNIDSGDFCLYGLST